MGLKHILSVGILITASVGIFAQGAKLTTEEFDTQVKAAFEATDKMVRRVSVTVTEFEQGKQAITTLSEYEYIPGIAFRSHLVTSSGPERDTWDYIEANGNYYIRNKGGWDYFAYGCSDIPPYLFWGVKMSGPGAEIKISERRDEKLTGSMATKYSRESRQNFETIEGYPPSPSVDAFEEVWIGRDGLVLRAEAVYFRDKKTNLLQKWVLNYEYNPKDLNIDAPIK